MDIGKAGSEADQTFSELLNTFSGIGEEKINTVPFEGSWTPGQLAQHIVLSAGGFVNLLNGPVKETERSPEANVGMLRSLFLNFDTKMKSPDFIVPEQKNYDKQKLTMVHSGHQCSQPPQILNKMVRNLSTPVHW